MTFSKRQHGETSEPGSPWENGYVESFIGKFRDKLLNGEIFDTLLEARVVIECWRKECNQFRPYSSLGSRIHLVHLVYSKKDFGPNYVLRSHI